MKAILAVMALCYLPGVGLSANLDLDADNKADLWWFNASSGEHWAYQLDGLSLKQSVPIAAIPAAWSLIGRGDFDGDGKADALWRHSSGELWLYLMNGNRIKQQLPFMNVALDWQLEAVADCNGDGTDDLLWWQPTTGELWLLGLKAAKVAESRSLFVAPKPWRLLAAADVDADHKKDLIWREPTTGEVWLTRQDGRSITSSRHWAWADLAWQMVAVGDFDGNGTDDLWWRHRVKGDNLMFLTQGDSYQEQTSTTVADLGWQPVLSRDINADGTDDLVWRNQVTGENWLYLLKKGQILRQGPLASAAPVWQVLQNPPLWQPADQDNAALVHYDFSAGDSLAAQAGWSFDTPNWPLTSVAGSNIKGIGFTYAGTLPGNYSWQEMRFRMPPIDSFWLQFRLHIPANYAHRFDTKIDLPASSMTNWQIGDWLLGTDGQSKGQISAVYLQASNDVSPGVFLRTPANWWSNEVWVGKLTNSSRQNSAVSSARAGWTANNKLAAIWADDYSAHGVGPTIAWELVPVDVSSPGQTSHSTDLTVHYSRGNNQGAGGHISATGEHFINTSDAGHYLDIILHGQFSSRLGAKDGIIQTWVRKEGESKYQIKHDIHDADMDKHSELPADQQQWQAGYLMGWSNSGFDQNTQFHISKINYYTNQPKESSGL